MNNSVQELLSNALRVGMVRGGVSNTTTVAALLQFLTVHFTYLCDAAGIAFALAACAGEVGLDLLILLHSTWIHKGILLVGRPFSLLAVLAIRCKFILHHSFTFSLQQQCV